jgi:hypothetical protein
MSDITDTLAPKSDQLDAVDLLAGPRTFTVESASVNNRSEQPVSIKLREFPRVWRPSKGMRRVLAALWGADSSGWVGRRLTLYCDKTVKFGGEEIGGTRISHMSHIETVQKVPMLVARGKAGLWTVEPLVDGPADPSADEIANATPGQVNAWWASHPHLRPSLAERAAQIKAQDAAADPNQGDLLDGEQ